MTALTTVHGYSLYHDQEDSARYMSQAAAMVDLFTKNYENGNVTPEGLSKLKDYFGAVVEGDRAEVYVRFVGLLSEQQGFEPLFINQQASGEAE